MKYMHRKLMAFFVLALMCSMSHSLSAISLIKYVDDVEYRGSMRYENTGYTLTYAESNEEKFKNIIEQARDITAFKTTLNNSIYEIILAEFGKSLNIDSLDQYQYDFDGPIVMELIGNPDGTITAKVGGFNVYAFAKGSKGIWYEAKVTADTNTFWLTGDYDILTGKIVGLEAQDFIINIDVDIDWIFDWVSLFVMQLTQYIENEVIDIVS